MNTTGYYGKIPQRGDFVSGRLPPTFIAVWDDWSQQLVSACKDTREEEAETKDTEQLWYRLPAYRFLVSSDIAGDQGWIGLMVPSKDSVGRIFPVCLARNLMTQGSPATTIYNHEQFFVEIETVATQLLSGELLLDNLTDTLKTLDEQCPTPATQSDIDNHSILRQSGTERLAIRLNAGLDPTQPKTWQLATESLLSIACAGYTIWTTSPLSKSSAETILCESFPTRSASAALFTGDFDTSSWSSLTLANNVVEHRESNYTETPSELTPSDGLAISNDRPPPITPTEQSVNRETDILQLDDLGELDELDSTAAPWDD